jgi:hypothetical protein
LTNVDIARALEPNRKELVAATGITRERILKEIADVLILSGVGRGTPSPSSSPGLWQVSEGR